MLLHDARRATRVDGAGDLVLLEHQDRTRWDRSEITEAVDLLEPALRRGRLAATDAELRYLGRRLAETAAQM